MDTNLNPTYSLSHSVQCISSDECGANEDGDEFSDSKNIVSKKKTRTEGESSSENSYLLVHVTSSNLSRDGLCLKKDFARSNGLNKRCCEIDLLNQHGKSWTLDLRYNPITDQACMRRGWRNFCFENGLETESFYKFKLIQNGTRPSLQLCFDSNQKGNCSSKANRKDTILVKPSSDSSVKQTKFLTLTLKTYMLTSGQLRLPRVFASENGIKKAGEINLMDKNGVKWPSYISEQQGMFYMAIGWRSFCAANELKAGEIFTLEYVRGQGTTPTLKFCSQEKVKIEKAPVDGSGETCKVSWVDEEKAGEQTETRVGKRARVCVEGGPSRSTLAPTKSSVEPIYFQPQPLQPCSIFDQVTKLKQSIVDTLTCVRRFRSELKIKEQILEVSLRETDALGEKFLE